MNVTKVLCRRSDLLSFFGQNGKRVTVDMPWFGAELANIGKECFSRAKPEYSYYCGFADDVHFHKNNRHLARFCHMPADL
ncbi:MAG: hypothetical protein P4L61_00795, partial [Candidatus Pacebacteria bacterium]|nr:hypothetical protein [Candidatus Paceibacterota bacterium]